MTPPGYKFLANLYAAEAHMGLGHCAEALALLDPKKNLVDIAVISFSSDYSSSASNNNSNSENSQDANGQQALARSIFQVSLAVAFILKGDGDKAEDMLEKIGMQGNVPNELSSKVLSLRLYLALTKGNVEKARELANRHFSSRNNAVLGFF